MQRRSGSGQPTKGQRTSRPQARKAPTANVSGVDPQEQLDRRTRERDEALEQQAATAEILKLISSSPTDTQPVFEAIVQSGLKLFPDAAILIALPDGNKLRAAAFAEADPARAKALLSRWPVPLTREYNHAIAILDRRIIDIPDAREAPPELATGAQYFLTTGYRAITIMPMMRGGDAIGALSVVRSAPGALSEKQIAVLRTFADQAVIAIENTRLLNELRESLQQQTATADVLKVISRSTFDLQTVLNTLVESACRLCDAGAASIWRPEGDAFKLATNFGDSAARIAAMQQYSHRPGRETCTGRVLLEGRPVQIPDCEADPEYKASDVLRAGGNRAMLGVPLLREGLPIGVLTLTRSTARPFTAKQIALATTFADQAVIAIENVRLFDEVQARTRELSESLEQQTATSEVLKVISSSPGELELVFNSILENATRICEAKFGVLWQRFDDGTARLFSSLGIPSVFAEFLQRGPHRPGPLSPLNRVAKTRLRLHIADFRADQAYLAHDPLAVAGVELGGQRTVVVVPMLKEDKLVGMIAVYRQEVRPFTDKQIELVENFAAQAVIAIENARLLNELRDRTRELAKSLEELRTAQDRLVQTQKLALLGQLTAGIAHEIKNPLNFVNNFSGISAELIDELRDALKGLLLDEKARAEIEELADTLKGNFEKVLHHGRRADAIVKNMLQHSREGSGEHRVIDINALVEESLNLAWHGARAETQGFEIKVKQSFDPSAGGADVFPQDIRRALLNVISNGFYAATRRRAKTNGGDYEPTLTASTKNLGDRVEIKVRDNGTGMTPDVKEKMFNPFFTTKPTGEGTGLGLSISHDIIVKQHTGTIEVDTKPGEFTEIRIVLPRVAAFV